MPYLQRAVLPREVRTEARVKETITALTPVITDRTGVPAPPPAPVVRISWRGLIQTALILVAAYALLTTLVDIDWATVASTWQHASWAWILVGLVIVQATTIADAASTMSAVTTRLPLWPLVQLQYAVKTVGLAMPSTVGKVAMTTSMLRKFGEASTVGATAVALDAAAGTLCNILVVLLGVWLVDKFPHLNLHGASDDLTRLVVLLVVAVAVSAVVVALMPRLRAKLADVGRSAMTSLRVVTSSPARALAMSGTNLASLLITALGLTCMIAGLHPGVGYGEAVFVAAVAALFGSLIPVPGNVGVGEAALTAGLVAVGVPSGAAFSIALTQRLATTYLPPIYGAWALSWLRRSDYLD